MIIGVGIDVLEVERVRKILERWGDRFLRRILVDSEIEYCKRHTNPAPQVAGRIAAKEAFFKATGLGLAGGMSWRHVAVGREATGKPYLELDGRAREVIEEIGAVTVHLTLSHESTMASAVVILEGLG
ncbi:MAG: holo-ACP synthase [Planctomycetes bacterium]|nr:holo-ACP synthase [Planctomycetota bacterium]